MQEFIKRSITAVVLVSLLGGGYYVSAWVFATYLLLILVLILVFEWPILVHGKTITQLNVKYWLITLLYPITPFVALVDLVIRYRSSSFFIPLLPFLIAWAADTGGYLVGKSVGCHKMCPSISPGKTWEGFLGSLLAVCAITKFVFTYIKVEIFQQIASSWLLAILVALILTWVAFTGDLMLSWLKRRQGLKDTGSLLPGHGGFLDRFDSVLFVVVVIWLLVLLG